jgi:predicted nucleic acid-binding Zn ribbon protein
MSEATQTKKVHIHPHRHCLYCGRMIEVKGRDYCLRCKPEYQKEQSKVGRSKTFRKMMLIYVAILGVVIVAIYLYSML